LHISNRLNGNGSFDPQRLTQSSEHSVSAHWYESVPSVEPKDILAHTATGPRVYLLTSCPANSTKGNSDFWFDPPPDDLLMVPLQL